MSQWKMWKPFSCGDKYLYIDIASVDRICIAEYTGSHEDRYRLEIGNCFEEMEEAEIYLKRIIGTLTHRPDPNIRGGGVVVIECKELVIT